MDLHPRAACFVQQRDELVAHQLVHLVGMNRNLRLVAVTHDFGNTGIDAVLVDVPGDGHQVGEHRVADGGGDGEVTQCVQADIDDAFSFDDIQPLEDGARVGHVLV